MNPLIQIENLTQVYPGARSVHALRGVDLTIRPGEYVAIIGANGSGKSTLVRHLNALLLPTRGDVWVGQMNTREPKLRQSIRALVQMVFQHPDEQLVATVVEEDVAFGLENFAVPEKELSGRVRESLERVGMWAHRQKAPHLLSAGQKQRVAIAGAIAVRPSVLVLDEATAMLDPVGRRAVFDIAHQLHAQGTTIIAITHDMDEAAHAERVIVMNEGCVAMDDTPRRVFARADELRALALDLPSAADLARKLGLPVCLTEQELVAELTSQPQSISSSFTFAEKCESQADDAILRVEQLSHWYLHGLPLESRALDRVDLSVPRGSALGLIGQTGSGKSTLMQHLNALLRPQSGRVIVGKYDLNDPAVDVRSVRRMVGLVFQQPEDQLFEPYVGDDVAFGPRQVGLDKAEVRERVRWAMESVGLGFDAFKDRMTITLSGGERRRAALAGVLALRPHVLVADEPTAGLDPVARTQVLAIFHRLQAEGTTLIVASHRMEDVIALCQRVAALDEGRIFAAGSTREILSQPDLISAHHLQVPIPARIAQSLRTRGWRLPGQFLSGDELVAALGSKR